MRLPESETAQSLLKVTTLREMGARAAYLACLRDERRLRSEIDRLAAPDNSSLTGDSALAAEKWRVWKRARRVALGRDLSMVLARKDMTHRALAEATAKISTIRKLGERAEADRIRVREARALEALLQIALNAPNRTG